MSLRHAFVLGGALAGWALLDCPDLAVAQVGHSAASGSGMVLGQQEAVPVVEPQRLAYAAPLRSPPMQTLAWVPEPYLPSSRPYLPEDAACGSDDGCGPSPLLPPPGWPAWTENLLVFGGVHGFKGPTDLGRNGNFGFHEGLNWAAPIGDPWGYNYQVGFQALHSNFAGNQVAPELPFPDLALADRNQLFFTAAVFRRAIGGGIQSGVAFDFFHDSYYRKTDLQQIRSETALVLSDLREIGYWGAYGISRDTITGLGQFDTVLDPTDLFAVFYRRHFSGGGQGRIWAGLSGDGDGIFGLDGTVPIGPQWALDNNFTYLMPKQGRRSGGQAEETWSVSIQLVWYPGRSAWHAGTHPSHPLFYVADNSWFLVDRRRPR